MIRRGLAGTSRRLVLIALGGNAIAPPASAGTVEEQTENIGRAMKWVADLVSEEWDVVLTHGNGPQVGNLLTKNEVAREIVPPVPLDWCVAQTQATIGHTIANTLGVELARRGTPRPVAPVISRVLVDRHDPAFTHPTKPIGRYLTSAEEVRRREAAGQRFVEHSTRGWRRVVASPEPIESLDRGAVEVLLRAGAVVVANGGGGVPTGRWPDGGLQGVEAVVDKDLAGACLAGELGVDVYVILTDVPGVAVHHATARERWLERVSVGELRGLQAEGHFAAGSMGPKVEAACRFVEKSGGRAVIASLEAAAAAVHGETGTQVEGDR
jgi:carbamate kinase